MFLYFYNNLIKILLRRIVNFEFKMIQSINFESVGGVHRAVKPRYACIDTSCDSGTSTLET